MNKPDRFLNAILMSIVLLLGIIGWEVWRVFQARRREHKVAPVRREAGARVPAAAAARS